MKSGTMLAHYRVVEKIGVGGMGEVYRAHDTRLGRDVAVKILPERFARDADRMTRFQREAKVLAALHHQNIASIFGFEQTDEATFLAMELVEGEDLSEILRNGALPVDDAVEIARQIAEGLEEAHEKGIVHRDLKPANVKRTPDGRVKVLDFGLARAFSGHTTGEEDISSAPTMTAAMTQAGTILGTAAYMSPEQARGQEVDRRTDIWAFGVILFELLTGKRLFAGETASDTLADILKSEPDWDELPDELPHQVERVLRRCLSKDPRKRLRDIGEARVRLDDPEAESQVFASGVSSVAPARDHRGTRGIMSLLPWTLTLLAVAAALWLMTTRTDPGSRAQVVQVGFPAPPGKDFDLLGSFPSMPQISPDGRHVVFGALDPDGDEAHLYVRSRDQREAVRLDGTLDAQYPFWSPDSEWVGFFVRGEGLKKIRVGGGPAQTICDAGNAKGGSWSIDDQIIFTSDYNTPLQIVAAVGGEPQPLTSLEDDPNVDSHRHPQFLPDGQRFLYLARGTGGNDNEIRIGYLDEREDRTLLRSDVHVRYASGHLLYVSNRTLMAQEFDLASEELVGQPFPLAESVLVITGAAAAAFSVSDEGSVVYLRGSIDDAMSLRWLDRNGMDQGTVGDEAIFLSVALAPDSRRAALAVLDRQAGTNDLWVLDIERNLRTRLTTHAADESFPVWHPDSRTVYFASDRTGRYAIFRKSVGSTREPELVLELDVPVAPNGFTPGGDTLIYVTGQDSTGFDIHALDLTGAGGSRALVTSPADDAGARISPDGNWIAYASDISGMVQTYLAPWPEMTPVTQVSTTSGTWCYWTATSDRLMFQEGDGRLLEVPLTVVDGEARLGPPEVLFDHTTVKFDGAWLDVAADGERFLTIEADDLDMPRFCDLIIDWPLLAPDR
jgi:Tol biopolymer transport system component